MAATAVKDRPSTKAQVRYVRMSASKARQVLELIRGKSVAQADDALALSERDVARAIQKVLRSAVANAEHNDGLDPDELFVSTCFADEGPTLRRFRPRARGRATRIRKRTCHITVVVSRYDADELAARRQREAARGTTGGRRDTSTSRRRRVARSRGEDVVEETPTTPADEVEETPTTLAEEAAGTAAEGAETVDEAIEAGTATAEELAEHHTKDELLELAEKAGVEVAKSWTKPQIAEAIVASREDD